MKVGKSPKPTLAQAVDWQNRVQMFASGAAISLAMRVLSGDETGLHAAEDARDALADLLAEIKKGITG